MAFFTTSNMWSSATIVMPVHPAQHPPPLNAKTASHSTAGLQGALFHEEQQRLIESRRYLDAPKMDVDNIRTLFGGKHEGALQQMGEALWSAHQ